MDGYREQMPGERGNYRWDDEEGEEVEFLDWNVFQQVVRSEEIILGEEWHEQIDGTEKAQDLLKSEHAWSEWFACKMGETIRLEIYLGSWVIDVVGRGGSRDHKSWERTVYLGLWEKTYLGFQYLLPFIPWLSYL